jgi:hypothetical protein
MRDEEILMLERDALHEQMSSTIRKLYTNVGQLIGITHLDDNLRAEAEKSLKKREKL